MVFAGDECRLRSSRQRAHYVISLSQSGPRERSWRGYIERIGLRTELRPRRRQCNAPVDAVLPTIVRYNQRRFAGGAVHDTNSLTFHLHALREKVDSASKRYPARCGDNVQELARDAAHSSAAYRCCLLASISARLDKDPATPKRSNRLSARQRSGKWLHDSARSHSRRRVPWRVPPASAPVAALPVAPATTLSAFPR